MGPGVRRDDERERLTMTIADKLVLQRQHHLKWRWLDRLELVLMIACGVLCFGFSLSVMFDIVTRTIGHPWLWLQEVTSTLFIYAIFIGAAVATRRNDHLYLTAISEALHGTPRLIVEIIIRLVVLGVAFCLIWFGYINYLRGFGSFRLPSGTPIASHYAIIPLSGILVALFTIEQLVNGIRNGFDHPEPPDEDLAIPPADAGFQKGTQP
jgi:TRAP-type C4-dicarboxylate transport system permease small subunit